MPGEQNFLGGKDKLIVDLMEAIWFDESCHAEVRGI